MDVRELTEGLMKAAAADVVEVDLSEYADNQRIYVDMTARKITGNNEFGVENDHLARRKVVEVTRYLDGVDLAEKSCAIHWENGENGGILPVTNIDLSVPGKILFQWEITNEFTQNAGTIVYAVHYFSITDGNFTYHAATEAAAGRIRKTLNSAKHSQENISASEIAVYIAAMNELKNRIDSAIANIDALVTSSVEKMFIPVTQEEYDALVESDADNPNKYYMIVG